jgi:hypothetical protein
MKDLNKENTLSEGEFTRILTSAIVNFFKNEGYMIEAEVVDRTKLESNEGIDVFFLIKEDIGGKLVGIQTKRPYGKTPFYKIDEDQHKLIKKDKWIYYALPDDINRKEKKNILYKTKFSKGNFDYSSTVRRKSIDTEDWGDFSKGIKSCNRGLKLTEENLGLLNKEFKNIINEYILSLLINFEMEKVKLIGLKEAMDMKKIKNLNKKKMELSKDKKGICPTCKRPY